MKRKLVRKVYWYQYLSTNLRVKRKGSSALLEFVTYCAERWLPYEKWTGIVKISQDDVSASGDDAEDVFVGDDFTDGNDVEIHTVNFNWIKTAGDEETMRD